MRYEIRIKGHLGPQWEAWFKGIPLQQADNGETILKADITDQAELFGLLRKVRDLGMPLIAVNPIEPGDAADGMFPSAAHEK